MRECCDGCVCAWAWRDAIRERACCRRCAGCERRALTGRAAAAALCRCANSLAAAKRSECERARAAVRALSCCACCDARCASERAASALRRATALLRLERASVTPAAASASCESYVARVRARESHAARATPREPRRESASDVRRCCLRWPELLCASECCDCAACCEASAALRCALPRVAIYCDAIVPCEPLGDAECCGELPRVRDGVRTASEAMRAMRRVRAVPSKCSMRSAMSAAATSCRASASAFAARAIASCRCVAAASRCERELLRCAVRSMMCAGALCCRSAAIASELCGALLRERAAVCSAASDVAHASASRVLLHASRLLLLSAVRARAASR